jgi:hypothetical protein
MVTTTLVTVAENPSQSIDVSYSIIDFPWLDGFVENCNVNAMCIFIILIKPNILIIVDILKHIFYH